MNGDVPRTPSHGSSFPHDVIEQRIAVPFEYPVYFSRDVFHPDNPLFESVLVKKPQNRPHRTAIFIDSGVVEAFPGLLGAIKTYFRPRKAHLDLVQAPVIIPGA